MLHGFPENRIDAEEHACISLVMPILEAYREHIPGLIEEARKYEKEQRETHNKHIEDGKV